MTKLVHPFSALMLVVGH